MDAPTWNSRHPIGTRVIVNLADGRILHTRSIAAAQRYGGLDYLEVAGIKGLVLLSWVQRQEAPAPVECVAPGQDTGIRTPGCR